MLYFQSILAPGGGRLFLPMAGSMLGLATLIGLSSASPLPDGVGTGSARSSAPSAGKPSGQTLSQTTACSAMPGPGQQVSASVHRRPAAPHHHGGLLRPCVLTGKPRQVPLLGLVGGGPTARLTPSRGIYARASHSSTGLRASTPPRCSAGSRRCGRAGRRARPSSTSTARHSGCPRRAGPRPATTSPRCTRMTGTSPLSDVPRHPQHRAKPPVVLTATELV